MHEFIILCERYTASEYRDIHNSGNLKNLGKFFGLDDYAEKLGTAIDQDTDKKFEYMRKFDDELDKRTNKLIGSNSYIEGLTKLLNLGNIEADFSKSDDQLKQEILKHKREIVAGNNKSHAYSSAHLAAIFSNLEANDSKDQYHGIG